MLSVTEGPFVPSGAGLDEIDRRWRGLCESNPAYYDGPCWHVLGVSRNGHGGAVLHVMESSFRFSAVQEDDFDVGYRGLGVRAIARRGSEVLIGRRGPQVARYAELWEFVPAGTLEPGVDPAEMIVRELREEAGLEAGQAPIPMAVLFDPVVRAWQIVFDLELPQGAQPRKSGEHGELLWCEADDLPAALSPVDQLMLPLLKSAE